MVETTIVRRATVTSGVLLLALSGAALAADSFATTERKMRALGIDGVALNNHMALHVTQWGRLTSFEKENVAKGGIVLLDMGTSDEPRMFRAHTRAAVQCMESESHGMNSRVASATIQIGIAECAARTYRRVCATCR